jgi:putative ABC transport system substrate-binding protein
MDRRNAVRYLALLGAVALAARAVHAQPARNFKVAILTTAGGRGDTPFYAAMERRFRELGYVEGKNLTLLWQSAAGRLDKIPEIAAELAKARPI